MLFSIDFQDFIEASVLFILTVDFRTDRRLHEPPELVRTCRGRSSSVDNPDGNHLLTLLSLPVYRFFFLPPTELPILKRQALPFCK
jgi:hypothetical protein